MPPSSPSVTTHGTAPARSGGGLCTAAGDCVENFFSRPNEDLGDRKLKRLMASAAIAVGIVALVILLVEERHADTYQLGMWIAVVCCIACLCAFRMTRYTPRQVGSVAVPSLFLVILLMDWTATSNIGQRQWVFIILVMDCGLVLGTSSRIQVGTMAGMLCYLTVERVEASARFGFYEASSIGEGREVQICDCGDPPCGLPALGAPGAVAGFAVVLVTDYYLTRGFAVALRQQMQLVDVSVSVAGRVASLLAAYDIKEAAEVVELEGRRLPPLLLDAFERLLGNLDSYRAYLPDTVLYQDGEDSGSASATDDSGSQDMRVCSPRCVVQPPGAVDDCDAPSEVALCFTDIQSSTELWEAFPQGMYEALQIHNSVMRSLSARCQGYEVKTIGDAFMLAFRSAEDACRFGIEAQQQLLRQRWPADLAAHHLCCRQDGSDGEPLWAGLRVRIGIHWGEARAERNPITGRFDYFGPTVNTAARVESVLQRGGLIGVTDAVISALGPGGLAALGDPAVVALGAKELKGVRDAVPVSLLLPQRLLPRKDVLSESLVPETLKEQARAGFLQGPRSPSEFCTVTSLDIPGCSTRASLRREASDVSHGSGQSARSKHSSRSTFSGFVPAMLSPNRHVHKNAGNANAQGLALRLRGNFACCCAARITLSRAEPIETRLAPALTAVECAADRTEGVLHSVLSALALITWNAGRHCTDSAACCRQFLRLARDQVRGVPIHFGAASGGVMSGNVAAGRRRFATVVGGCVELAAALAEEAELCEDPCLAVGPVATLSAAAGCADRAQLWLIHGQEADGLLKGRTWSLSQQQTERSQQSSHPPERSASTAGGEVELVVWSVAVLSGGEDRWGNAFAQRRGDDEPADALEAAFRAAAVVSTPAQQIQILNALDDVRVRSLVLRAERGALRTRRVAPVWDPVARWGVANSFTPPRLPP